MAVDDSRLLGDSNNLMNVLKFAKVDDTIIVALQSFTDLIIDEVVVVELKVNQHLLLGLSILAPNVHLPFILHILYKQLTEIHAAFVVVHVEGVAS